MPITITFQISGSIGEEDVKLTGRFDVPDGAAAALLAAAGTSVSTARPVTTSVADEFGPMGNDGDAFDDETKAALRKPGSMRVVVATQYALTAKTMEFRQEGRKFAEAYLNNKSPLWKSWVEPRLPRLTKDGETYDLPATVKVTLLVSDKKNTKGNYYEDIIKIETVTE